jgi:nitrate reductase NapE component
MTSGSDGAHSVSPPVATGKPSQLENQDLWQVHSDSNSWWTRGDVEAKLNTVNMTAWVHKECDIIGEEALAKLQAAWNSSEQKDECIVFLNDLERACWMVTEIGQLGGYGFQGVTLGVDGSCKDGKMGSGCENVTCS